MLDRVILFDVAAIEGPRTSWRFLIMFIKLVVVSEIVECRATSLDVIA